MPQLVIGLVALMAVIYIIGYVLAFAVGASIPVLLGMIVYHMSISRNRDTARNELLSDAGKVINATLSDRTLTYSVNKPELKSHISAYSTVLSNARWEALSASALACVVAYVAGAFKLVKLMSGEQFPDSLMFFLAGVASIGGTAAIIGWRSKPAAETIHQLLQDHLEKLNQSKPILDDFAKNSKEKLLEIPPTASHESELRNILVNRRHVDIIASRVSIADALSDLLLAQDKENKSLQRASESLAKVMMIFGEASRVANTTGNLALLYDLDQYGKGIKDARRVLLPEGRYEEFHGLMEGATEELQKLIANAEDLSNRTSEDAAEILDENDPYSILGVRTDLNDDDLKKVYRTLRNLYHPDKGLAPDHRKFQEIDGAWRKLKSARNM